MHVILNGLLTIFAITARTGWKPSGTFRGQKDCSGELAFVPPQDFDGSSVVGEIASSEYYHLPVRSLHLSLMLFV